MLSVHIVRRPKLKKLIAVCLASLFIFCCSDQMAKLPDYWEYVPGKWVAFKENIELEWKYDESKVDKFKIDKSKVVLKDDDIREIIKLIRKKDVDGLVAKEISLRSKLKFDEKMENYNSAEEMNFMDKKEPIPTFGEIHYYSISAIKKYSTSVPAGLSVILLDRSK